MTPNQSIRLKALFLLTVFAMNTVVGFACSIGLLDAGPKAPHHGKVSEKGTVHIHKDGKRHIHKAKPVVSHQHAAKETASGKDDCCKEKVVKLQKADKSLQYSKIAVDARVYLLHKDEFRIGVFNTVDPLLQEYIACHFHPPPQDIRIAIQSFQI